MEPNLQFALALKFEPRPKKAGTPFRLRDPLGPKNKLDEGPAGSQIDMGGLIPAWATSYLSSVVVGKAGEGAERRAPSERGAPKRGGTSLDCYWVGSLDFNFLGNNGVFH